MTASTFRFPSALLLSATLAGLAACHRTPEPAYDLVIRNARIIDGSGQPGFAGALAVKGDRIAALGPTVDGAGRTEVDARGLVLAPGFINMLSWSTESLLADGRGMSELRQGVTLQVMGEGWSMGPLTPEMEAEMRPDFAAELGDAPLPWTTLDEYLSFVANHGVTQNIASFVGATTVRLHTLGRGNLQPSDEQLRAMRRLVRDAMEDGALGVASALIYVPSTFATTEELVALAETAGACGGIYVTHMRSETDQILEAVDETLTIARRSGTPTEIYHLKMGGQANWDKLDEVVGRIEAARADGLRITTDMYPYVASATGLDAAMPPWVQEGGVDAWIERLGNPEIRARVAAEMQAETNDWENLYRVVGGAENMLLAAFENPDLQPLVGKTLAEVAEARGTSPEETAMDLVIEDGSRVGVAYFAMSEANTRAQLKLPYMSFGSDSPAVAAEGDFLKYNPHPRAYGTFARVLGHYVRDEQVMSLTEAVRKMTSQPADHLGLLDRGRLQPGAHADLVLFDPATITDHATFAEPHQYATGVSDVWVNGTRVLADGQPTEARPGRVVRGRGWSDAPAGGCRTSPAEWTWPGQPEPQAG
ncbi:D-aminoacylase [uncultured Abyssibacter sp.]|uniref:N-acyl-D-amino-acid deacylase family protein n=1 Tax=uncultured Abyssibacter sp. TaxID=2320202 RepID=UPI0032B20A9F